MARRRGNPRVRCSICLHADRTRAELLLAGGAAVTSIARRFEMSRDALNRHWRAHVDADRRSVLSMGPVKKITLAAHISEEAESVIDHYRAVRAGLYRFFDAALEAGDRNGGALVAGRLLSCLDSMGRLTGQLATSPLVQNTTVNFYMLPEFSRFQADLIRVLSRFPEAREAVITEFERLESAPSPASLPALEHRADGVAASAR